MSEVGLSSLFDIRREIAKPKEILIEPVGLGHTAAELANSNVAVLVEKKYGLPIPNLAIRQDMLKSEVSATEALKTVAEKTGLNLDFVTKSEEPIRAQYALRLIYDALEVRVLSEGAKRVSDWAKVDAIVEQLNITEQKADELSQDPELSGEERLNLKEMARIWYALERTAQEGIRAGRF